MPEDFSSGGTPVQAGVLDFSSGGTPLDFASGGMRVKKTREQVMAEVGAAQGRMDRVNPPETLSGLEKVGNAAYWPTRALSGQDFLPAVENIIAGGLNQTLQTSAQLQGLPQYPQDQLPYQGGRPIIPIDAAHDQSVAPVDRALLKFIEGLTTPANVALLPLGGMQNAAGKVVASTFIPPMVQGTVEQGQAALNPGLPTGDRQEAAVSALLSGLMTLGLGKQLTPNAPVPSGVVAPDTRNPVYDRPGGGDLVGPTRQLAAPGERPTPMPGVPMDRPTGAARFGVDPMGRAVDVSQLSPKEQTELYRGPKESVPRETYVRPAQQSPVILGEQPNPQREVVFQNETAPIKPVFVPSRPPVEPSGGEISFRAPASAEGIPNAGQSAPKGMQIKSAMEMGQERRGETGSVFPQGNEGRVPERKEPKPEVAKLNPASKNLNPLGDPMGTTYYGTAEDMGAYKAAQERLRSLLQDDPGMEKPETMTRYQEVVKENERVKNKYGGMPPVEPRFKEVIGSEKEIRKEEGVLGSGGIGSGMTKAIEKNREGGSVPNPFPFIVEKFKNKEKE